MGNTEESRSVELCLNGPLQLRIRLDVDTAGSLIKDNHTAILHQSTGKGQQLLFASAKVGAFIADDGVQAEFGFCCWVGFAIFG